MDEIILALIGLCAACIMLAIYCNYLNHKIEKLESIAKVHREEIQHLHSHKENRKPGFEMTSTSKEQCDAMVRNLEKIGSVTLLRK